MSLFNRLPNGIIKKSFDFSVHVIEKRNDIAIMDYKLSELNKMQKGTLGRAIADTLNENNVRLIPGYESHDLKHVVLDYKMTPVDEIRMQAYMLGNGNYTFPCIIILLFGSILLPCKWQIFIKDFKQGRSAPPISSWTIEEFAYKDVNQLRVAAGR
jgi:ubiquinone biosynthesis protein Coq4